MCPDGQSDADIIVREKAKTGDHTQHHPGRAGSAGAGGYFVIVNCRRTGARAGWPKAAERRSPVDATRVFLVVAPSGNGCNGPDLWAVWLPRHRTG